MKENLFFATICCLLLITCKGPSKLSNTISIDTSEILNEGNLLYKYEKSAWVAGDLALKNPIVAAEYGDYFTYEENGVIKTIILDESRQTCIAEYTFENNFENPKSVKIEKRELSEKEKILIDVQDKISKNILEGKYEITTSEGYGLNGVLLPFADKYKFYIITGTSLPNIIPFGNDYIFIADLDGKIESWQKFPPRFRVLPEGMKVEEMTRTHITDDPLITAADICTFMLYAPLYDIDAFSVISQTGLKMRYSLKENTIMVDNIFK
ncbi:MAG: hypothetical protein LBH22_02470 [Bacteroidales bacterium]|jgi:hypothetical protein|nr:hypothetical protein [Bacteroidales bacterium]